MKAETSERTWKNMLIIFCITEAFNSQINLFR